jgi:putative transposase
VQQKRCNVEQIVAVSNQAEAGVPLAELIRRVGISEQTFYRWKKQYVGLEVGQVRQLRRNLDKQDLKRIMICIRPPGGQATHEAILLLPTAAECLI